MHRVLSDIDDIDLPNPTDLKAVKLAEIASAAIFARLRPGAPADVAPAIDDLVSALGKLAATVDHPGQADAADLQTLLSDVQQDTTQLEMYDAGNCPRS